MARMIVCEVSSQKAWATATIHEVLERRARGHRLKIRCPECQGQVRAHKEANNGMQAHFEHLEAHKGCSNSTTFNGRRTQHPKPIL